MNINRKSRTEYAVRNALFAVVGNVITMLLGYVSRIYFTHTFSEDYIGLNGLFLDILSVLSLSELGFGTAIAFALYEPVKKGDIDRQKSYMALIKKYYYYVAGIIFVTGICLIPFLDFFVKSKEPIPYLALFYLLYLSNTVLSYWNIYKKTLLDATQMNYVYTLIRNVCWTVQVFIQIVVLITTKSFILYVLVMIFGTVVGNIFISIQSDKLFPYLREKDIVPISSEDKKPIIKNVKAMVLHKSGEALINNTDNLLLSSLVGLSAAGLYSNYYLIIESVRIAFSQMFQSIAGSIGNLGVTEDKLHIKKIFEALFLGAHWIFGLAAIILYEVSGPLVGFSFGQQYILDNKIVFVLCLNFYMSGVRQSNIVFRDSLGLFYYDRYKSIIAAIINLICSIFLGIKLGIVGIFIGTFIGTVTTSFWVEPYILYTKRFKCAVYTYFIKYMIYSLCTGIIGVLCDFLCKKVMGTNLVLIGARSIICFAVINVGFLVLYANTKEFKLLAEKGMYFLKIKLVKG